MPVVKRSRKIWTSEDDAELLGYYRHGLRATYIAEQMGLTIASVEARYKKLKKAKANDG